jgi:threonine dehydratase
MPASYVTETLKARVYDVAEESPLDQAIRLSERLHHRILLKREDTQPVFSFKLRGAYNKIFHLTEQEKSAGVIAASAGNHAQGVALASKQLHVSATIVMPVTTPTIKVENVRRLGGKAIQKGDSYDEAYQHAMQLAEQNQLTFIHPFDDPYVIAGQGTIGMEILRQHPDPIEAVFVPVGGGGLIAGIAAYIKSIRPEISIIGVEPEDTPTLYSALKAGQPINLERTGLFADGVAVKRIGTETFRIAQQHVDEVILVNTDQICAAIKDIFDDTRSVAEPAGALAVAGIKKYAETRPMDQYQTLVAILSGANINFDRLRHVAERTEIGEQREILLAVEIPEKPGSFLQFCQLLGKHNITEFNYRYADRCTAHVFCGIELSGNQKERNNLIERLKHTGYSTIDMTDNETAKLHIRYMVGGHAPQATNEKLYRFEFPERPGALLSFLSGLSGGWNISLFHYRNHGAAYGRVLVGIQLTKTDQQQFESYLQDIKYNYIEETHNQAYHLFARGG